MGINELQHHGIPGMKWGIRRFQNKDGSLTSAGKKRRADDSDTDENKQKPEPVKKKTIKDMSEDELRARINRLQLEKQYATLMKETNPPKSTKGRDFVLEVLKRSGENLLPQVINHYGANALNSLIGTEAIYANNKKK
jgi:hypothetical protein